MLVERDLHACRRLARGHFSKWSDDDHHDDRCSLRFGLECRRLSTRPKCRRHQTSLPSNLPPRRRQSSNLGDANSSNTREVDEDVCSSGRRMIVEPNSSFLCSFALRLDLQVVEFDRCSTASSPTGRFLRVSARAWRSSHLAWTLQLPNSAIVSS